MTDEFDQNLAAIRRAADVAADYKGLQGLFNVGLGVGLLFTAVPGYNGIGALFMIVITVAGHTYYVKKYGRATPQPRRNRTVIIVWFLGALLVWGGLGLDASGAAPIALGALVAAVALIGFDLVAYRHVGVTALHWALIVILALAALAPALGWLSIGLWNYSLGSIAIVLVIQGLVDHWRLTRAMEPTR